MKPYILKPAELSTQSYGSLEVSAVSILGSRPINDAKVRISYTGNPTSVVEELNTDPLGKTERIELPAPPAEFSQEPGSIEQPYSEYNIQISAPGFETVVINGSEIYPGVTSLQNQRMIPLDGGVGGGSIYEEGTTPGQSGIIYVIPPNTLFGDYPPKIAESEIKTVEETGEIVLSRVVIPEFVVVHDGPPSDASAQNHYVRYADYIKNVASSEIYATWPEETIYANILAIMSFTLNRVYTEWYRNQYFFWSKIHPD